MTAKMPSQGCCPVQQSNGEFVAESEAEGPLEHSHRILIAAPRPHVVNGEYIRIHSEISGRLNRCFKSNDLTTGAPEPGRLDSGIGSGSKPSSPTDEREVNGLEQTKMKPSTPTKDTWPKRNEQAKGKAIVKPDVKPRNKSRPARLTFEESVEKDVEWFMSQTERGRIYRSPRFVGQEIGPKGGHLEIKDNIGSSSVHLILPEGAVEQPQPIYMAVNWDTHSISPRVKLGPPGRKFNKCVYLKIPLHSGYDKNLALIRREDENSEWMENPETAKCLHLGNDAMIEISSFSDYEVKLRGQFFIRWLHVYVQQSTVGDGVMVRVYLTKDRDNETLKERENGWYGVRRRKTHVPLDIPGVNPQIRLELICERGLKAIDFNSYRDIPYTSLTHMDECGTTYLLRFTGDKQCTFHLEFKSGGFQLCERLSINIQRMPDDLSPQERSLLKTDMEESPLNRPPLLFSTAMVEQLAVLLDDKPSKVHELAEKMNMPGCNPIPKFRVQRFGSPTRCALYFFQCLCKEKSYDKETSLRLLRKKLDSVGLERASDEVAKFLLYLRRQPQEHTEEDQVPTLDTGACSDTVFTSTFKDEDDKIYDDATSSHVQTGRTGKKRSTKTKDSGYGSKVFEEDGSPPQSHEDE